MSPRTARLLPPRRALAPVVALLLVVEQNTGRYSLAAIAGGIYALSGAALSPVAGRIADRIGPSPVLLGTAVAPRVRAVLGP